MQTSARSLPVLHRPRLVVLQPRSHVLMGRQVPSASGIARLSTAKDERDSFLAQAREEEEQEAAEEQRQQRLLEQKARRSASGREWDGASVSRKIVEKLRKEGRGGGDDDERYERMARAQEYRLKRQMEQQQKDEQERLARIERQQQAERERREAEAKQKEEDKKKGGWFKSFFGK